jgi:plastocyanin
VATPTLPVVETIRGCAAAAGMRRGAPTRQSREQEVVMTRARRVITLTAAVVAAMAIAGGPIAAADPSMTFGRPKLGTGCSPGDGCFHDASFQAMDKIEPKAMAVSTGTTVQFPVGGFHQVAIYEAGTTREEIVPAGFTVDDPNGRIFLGPSPFAGDASTSFTFESPGKYLLICNIAPHFQFTSMWGYVTVR